MGGACSARSLFRAGRHRWALRAPRPEQSQDDFQRSVRYFSAAGLARGFNPKLTPIRLIAFMAAMVSVRSTRSFWPNTAAIFSYASSDALGFAHERHFLCPFQCGALWFRE